MVKFVTKQANDMSLSRHHPAPQPSHAATADAGVGGGGGVTYQELVLDGERLVLELPDHMAAPDGVIRLLQYVAADGSVQYVAATADQQEDLPLIEQEVTSCSVSTDTATVFADGHTYSQYASHTDDVGGASPPASTNQRSHVQPALANQRSPTQPAFNEKSTADDKRALSAAAAVGQQHNTPSSVCIDYVPPTGDDVITADQDNTACAGSVDVANTCDVVTSGEVGRCYVCGETPTVGSAVWPLLDARCVLSRDGHAPAVAELLADVLDRELTITSDDVVCAGCLAVVNQCARPHAPLYQSSAAYLHNLFAYGVGDEQMKPMPVICEYPLRRGPGRPRRALTDRPRLPADAVQSASWRQRVNGRHVGARSPAESGGLPHGVRLGARGAVLSGLKRLPDDDAADGTALPTPRAHNASQQLLIVPDAADIAPKRKYTRKKLLRRPGRMYSRYQLSQQQQQDEDIRIAVVSDAQTAEQIEDEDGNLTDVTAPPPPEGETDVPHAVDCVCSTCERHERHRPADGEHCRCVACVEMRACRVPHTSGVRCRRCGEFETDDAAQFRRHWRACRRSATVSAASPSSAGQRIRAVGRQQTARPYGKRRGRPAEPQKCSTCGEMFGSVVLLKEHCAESGHDKRLPCPFCHKLYHPEILKTHKLSHTGAFHCKLCDVFFCSKETLLYHMNRHSGARPFKCSECDKGFRSPSTLFMHHRRNHTQEKPYRCARCPKRFAARMELEFHVRQHTGVRPFGCRQCDKTYASRGSLTKHLLTHSQQRPFACGQCDKRFFSRTTYRAHMNVHNNVRPFACEFCGKTFYSQNKMSRHRKLNCQQARVGRGGISEDIDDMVLTVEVEADCEVRVTSVDEPLADGAVVLAENRTACVQQPTQPSRRPWTATRRAASLYGRLQRPFCLVGGGDEHDVDSDSAEHQQQHADETEMTTE